MIRFVRWSFTCLAGALWLAGPQACKSSAECLRHTDCTREERCDLGTCVMKPTPGSGLGDAGAGASDGQPTSGGRVSASGGTPPSSGGQRPNAGGAAGSAGDAGAGASGAGAGG